MKLTTAQTGWYLVFTKPHLEQTAQTHLTRQGFQCYLPLMQQHKLRRNLYRLVTEPLFPRYLFIHLDAEIDDWSKIRSTRGCVSLVRFGMLPARVPEQMITALQENEKSHCTHKNSSIPEFKPGDTLEVIDGILAGYEGIFEAKNSQQRVSLLLKVAEGHTTRVSLPVHVVRVVNG